MSNASLDTKRQSPFHVAIFDGDTLIDVIAFDTEESMGDTSDIITEWNADDDTYTEVNYQVVFKGEMIEESTFSFEYDANDELYEAYRERHL